jgi:hypothetical protein
MSALLAQLDLVPFPELDFHDEVPVACSAEVRYAASASGERWVAKRCARTDVIAEACGWLLARELDVPVVARVAVSLHEQDLWWLGALVHNAGHFTPSASQQVSNPEALGRVLLLDALLGNEDRHTANLLVEHSANGPRVIAIDFAGSWAGSPSTFVERGDEAPSVARLAAGITRGLVSSSAEACAVRAEALSTATLSAIAFEACRVAGYGRHEDLDEALTFRFARARVILSSVLSSLP